MWRAFDAVEVLTIEESQRVEATSPKDHILSTRVCYKNRNAGKKCAEIDAKARLVIEGYKAPNIVSSDGTPLRRDSPTVSRHSVLLILQVAASRSWVIWSANASNAFMQGDKTQDNVALYLRQPAEGLPGLRRGQLMKVLKGIYGLMDAPRGWWLHLKATLLKLGLRQCSLDPAVFKYETGSGIILLLCVHVDDVLVAVETNQQGQTILDNIWGALVWGKKQKDDFEWCG